MAAHLFEYSKSSLAKCHGPPPCRDSQIEIGSLRYGETIPGSFGETVEWRHWGCVTLEILGKLVSVSLEHTPGFSKLRPEDQSKIRMAVIMRRLDPSDVTKLNSTLNSAVKRKATSEAAASLSQPMLSQSSSNSSQYIEDFEQDIPQEEVRDELYCILSTSVVGIQYYKGLVGPGEQIRLNREPHNKYDRNAIQVMNIGNNQVGHIPRNVAAKLTPLMDRNLVTVEGVMNEGNLYGRSYSLSMTLKIYGLSDRRELLEPQLIWATPGQKGFAPRNQVSSQQIASRIVPASAIPSSSSAAMSSRRQSGSTNPRAQIQQEAVMKQQEALQKAAELKQVLLNLEKVDDEGRRTSLLDTLCSTDDVLNLPLHPNPPGKGNGLEVDLLKHQSQALLWCIEREYPELPKKETDKPVQFWQLRKNGAKNYYYNIATGTPQESPPVLGRGALCADSMGLGKTLTMLALILATKEDVSNDFSKATLIVAPLSVMSNWEKQINDHCSPNALKYCVYYGTKRSMTPEQLKQFDVIITTYQTVTAEHPVATEQGPSKKKKRVEKGLFDVRWKRIILDEGHNIRNARTKMAQGVCGLTAQRRWVLSGTPIINSPSDLGSIISFLQICRPLDNADFYKRLLLRPLKDGDPSGAELLRALMSHICIRRTKEMQDSQGNYLVPLPQVEMTLVPVTLHAEARALYDAVEQVSKQRIEGFIDRNGGLTSVVQSNVLSMLTRMRQITLHPGLVPANYLEQLQASEDDSNAPTVRLTPEAKMRLQGLLAQAIEDNEECPICFSILTEPRITSCAHAFCFACIKEVLSRDPKCPMDRRLISMGDLVEPAPPTELTQAPVRQEVEVASGSSAKVDQLVHLLKLTPATEKSLVFSQFTSFLDKIAEAFEENGISYVRFDGRMSAKRREETIRRFCVPIEENAPMAPPAEDTNIIARTRRRSNRISLDDEDVSFADIADDADFIVNDEDDSEDQDDAFLTVSHKRRVGREGKGKEKFNVNPRADLFPCFGDTSEANPKVMLISLKAGALGLNLTVANNVYLMDPWWQEGIESQAIDRCNRIGQKKPVHVYQLIAENTVESKVIDIQERKKLLIKEAFSGIKRTETQREKKEARIQDLIELFGIRQQTSSAHSS